MLIQFAKFATLVASETDQATYITDHVAMGDTNKASAIPVVHYANGPNTPSFIYTTQVSNDGIYWVDQGPTETIASPVDGAQTQIVAAINGIFIRVKFEYLVAGAGADTGAVCYDFALSLEKE